MGKKRPQLGPLLVRLANENPEPLAGLEMTTHKEVSISFHRASEAPPNVREWAFQLTTTNMSSMYEASNWGWNPSSKQKELSHSAALYLVAKRQCNHEPCGFVHFRFDMDFGHPVVYCYEIQLEADVQRHGLGTFLMGILEKLAAKFRMHKVVLTVFRSNTAALAFYLEKIGYRVDSSSPSEDEADYVILSKKVQKDKGSSPK
ncbi:N-alpha-acetyltransferase 40-like [Ornithodoros turicata]